MAIGVAGDVEPGAGIDEGGIPALKDVSGIGESASQGVESVSFGIGC